VLLRIGYVCSTLLRCQLPCPKVDADTDAGFKNKVWLVRWVSVSLPSSPPSFALSSLTYNKTTTLQP
jgi:hypothetical protein